MDRSTDTATHGVTRTTTVPMSLDEAELLARNGRAGRIATALHAELERLRGALDQDGDALAWLLIREQAVVDAWRDPLGVLQGLVRSLGHTGARLAEELDEMAEHRDDPADIPAVRELARLRAVEYAAREWATARIDDAHVAQHSIIPSAQRLLVALGGAA